MVFLCLLEPNGLSAVRRALGTFGTVIPFTSAPTLLAALAHNPHGGLVFDPGLVTLHEVRAIADEVARCPRPLIAFASLSAAALQVSVALAQRSCAEFVFVGSSEERSQLTRALLAAPDAMIGAMLVEQIGPRLRPLPVELQDAVRALLRGVDGAPTPDALARQGGVARRSMDRWITAAGLRSARYLVATARVVRAYPAIVGSRLSFQRIATLVGLASQRTLDQQLLPLTGATSAQLRLSPVPPVEIVDRIVRALCSESDETAAARSDRGDKSASEVWERGRAGAAPKVSHSERWLHVSGDRDRSSEANRT